MKLVSTMQPNYRSIWLGPSETYQAPEAKRTPHCGVEIFKYIQQLETEIPVSGSTMTGCHRYRQYNFLLFAAVICLLMPHVCCLDDSTLPKDLFYPFGTDVGDSIVPPVDDTSAGPIKLASAFPLHNASYSQLYVSWQFDVLIHYRQFLNVAVM